MRHEEVRAALHDYLEGELATPSRRRVEEHLQECASCRAEHHELRATVELLRGLPDPEPPASLLPALLRRLESEPVPPGGLVARGLRGFGSVPLPASIAALAAGLLVLAVASPWDAWLGFDDAVAPTAYELRGSLVPPPQGAVRVPAAQRRAAPAPPVVIPGGQLEPFVLDAAGVQRGPLRRLALSPLVGASAAPGAQSAALLPPRLSLAACAAGPSRMPGAESLVEAGCLPWLQGMLALARYDPPGFLDEVEALPEQEREGWLVELARFSHEARSADDIASRLRAAADARAAELARWFEARPGQVAR